MIQKVPEKFLFIPGNRQRFPGRFLFIPKAPQMLPELSLFAPGLPPTAPNLFRKAPKMFPTASNEFPTASGSKQKASNILQAASCDPQTTAEGIPKAPGALKVASDVFLFGSETTFQVFGNLEGLTGLPEGITIKTPAKRRLRLRFLR